MGAPSVEAARNLHDRELSNLVGELATRSDAFRALWADHDVHVYQGGTKRLRHPDVGKLKLAHAVRELPRPRWSDCAHLQRRMPAAEPTYAGSVNWSNTITAARVTRDQPSSPSGSSRWGCPAIQRMWKPSSRAAMVVARCSIS